MSRPFWGPSTGPCAASSTVVGLITATVLPALTLLIPTLYGEEFASASPLFLALGLAGALLVVATPVSVFVHARLQGRALLTASAVALVVDVGLAFALIPTLGAWGAVIANIGGSMTQIYILLRSELRAARTSWTETLRHSRCTDLRRRRGGRCLGRGTTHPRAMAECRSGSRGRPAAAHGIVPAFREGMTRPMPTRSLAWCRPGSARCSALR